MTEKLHKVLARAGLASRRRVERWIEQGRVTVNGRVARLGARVGAHDSLTVDGRPVSVSASAPATARILLYHKPLGELVTRHDPRGRAIVFRALPEPRRGRWVAVGRLDINSTGLLLFSDDGGLANHLMHPRAGLEREYLVRVYGVVSERTLERLRAGIKLDGRPAAFRTIVPAGRQDGLNRSFRVVLLEGRNREVRRLWEAVGCKVNRLKRIRYGPVKLPPDLAPGQWRTLPSTQLRRLVAEVTPAKPPPGGESARPPTRG